MPSGATAQTARKVVPAVAGALVLGPCLLLGPLGPGPGTPSKPTRIESRDEALTRADRIQDHVRDLTGLERNPWGKLLGYYRCPGRGRGIADEGEAYQLSSAIQLEATDDQRPEVLRALREKLVNEGFKITWTESGPATRSASPSGGFEVVHASDRYSVSLEGEAKADQGVVVVVTLPCQAPPAGAAAPAPTVTT